MACQKAARQVVCRRRACPFQECAPRASMPGKRFGPFGGKGMEGHVIPMLERRTKDRLRLVVHVEQRGSAMLRSHVGVPTHMFLSTGSQRVGWARRWWSMVGHAFGCGATGAHHSTALGGVWLQRLQPQAGEGPPLDRRKTGASKKLSFLCPSIAASPLT